MTADDAIPDGGAPPLPAIRRACGSSPFWSARLRAAGIRPSDLRPGFAWTGLPLLDKQAILADQAAAPPFGTLLAVPEARIRRIHRTSGTSATPFIVALTERDARDSATSGVRAFRAAGMGPGMRVAHCLSFNMWSGGVTDYLPIEATGATGIPFGVGNTDGLLRMITTLRIDAISATPSYMLVLRDRCLDGSWPAPRDLGLRRGFFGGEGLLQVPGVRAQIEEIFGMAAFDANYGLSEVLSIIAGEDGRRDGLIWHAGGLLHAELVDAALRPVEITPGACGELVLSTSRREAQPLFRYRTNDQVEIVECDESAGGAQPVRLRIRGRTDDMLVVKGVNLFPQSLLGTIAGFSDVGSQYRLVRPRPGSVAPLTLLVETPLPAGERRGRLEAAMVAAIRSEHQVTATVRWVAPGALPRPTGKARFLIDDPDATLS